MTTLPEKSVILLEFNELCPTLMERFMKEGKLPNFQLCTALSQQPCFTYEKIGGKHLYRPRRFEELLAFAGVTSSYECSPVMAEEFFIRFKSEAEAQAAEQKLAALRVDQRRVMRLQREGVEIYAGCGIFEQLPAQVTLENTGNGAVISFFRVFYQIEDVKSGMHHADGILWIRTPALKHRVHGKKVSLTCIAPAITNILEGSAPVIDRDHQLV